MTDAQQTGESSVAGKRARYVPENFRIAQTAFHGEKNPASRTTGDESRRNLEARRAIIREMQQGGSYGARKPVVNSKTGPRAENRTSLVYHCQFTLTCSAILLHPARADLAYERNFLVARLCTSCDYTSNMVGY